MCMQGDDKAGAPTLELLLDWGVEGGIIGAGPLGEIEHGGVFLKPEGERMPGRAAMHLVIGDKGILLAEKEQDFAGFEDISTGPAEFIKQALTVAEVLQGAFEEIPRVGGFRRTDGQITRERRLAAAGAF